ncbi:hypothetical protein [Neorhizobium sp. LjRoot104]|uniref:hypothetical protein n=1 Tax=Neorhizobium sp. LjRoot104 TaxID=3342254 RepID=UPI003ED07825
MRKFIAACIIGLGCLTTTAAPTLADSFSITIGDRGYRPAGHPYRPGYHRYHRPHYRQYSRHHYRPHCKVRRVEYRHHGRWVTKTTRVCR